MAIGPGDELAWGDLGDALMQRRVNLGSKNRGRFAEDRNIGYRLVYDIEENRRTNFARATMLDIARAYQVTPASIDRKLRRQGELEPSSAQGVPLAAAPAAPGGMPATQLPQGIANAIADLAETLVPAIEREVSRARMRNPDAAGRDIFTDEYEAQIWDIYANEYRNAGIDQVDETTPLATIALLRARRQARRSRDERPGYPKSV